MVGSIPTLPDTYISTNELCSNKADLQLLEEMGITPDVSFREKKPTLKTVGTAVVACLRMQRWQKQWSESKALEASLLKKLEGMRRKGKVAAK